MLLKLTIMGYELTVKLFALAQAGSRGMKEVEFITVRNHVATIAQYADGKWKFSYIPADIFKIIQKGIESAVENALHGLTLCIHASSHFMNGGF